MSRTANLDVSNCVLCVCECACEHVSVCVCICVFVCARAVGWKETTRGRRQVGGQSWGAGDRGQKEWSAEKRRTWVEEQSRFNEMETVE